jgi:hypothetical protein
MTITVVTARPSQPSVVPSTLPLLSPVPAIRAAYKITTYAGGTSYGSTGDGAAATSTKFMSTYGVAVDANGDLFIADRSNHAIRKVTASTNIITTYAGTIGLPGHLGDGGAATSAELHYPGV